MFSEQINEIACALSKAQAQLETVTKDQKGYGYNYSSLTSTIQATKPILSQHGLAITQLIGTTEGNRPSVTTILMHSSGQWIKGEADLPLIEMKSINEAQRAGAVYSYLRRYGIQAILNLSSEDSDANVKPQRPPQKQNILPAQTNNPDPGEFLMPFGKTKGLPLKKLSNEQLESALDWMDQNIKEPKGAYKDFYENAKKLLG